MINGDNITASYSTTATSSSDVKSGGYAITATLNDPNSRLSNYTVTNNSGTLTITQASQTISWSNPANINYGTALGSTQLDATVSVVGPAAAGALTYTPVAGTVLNAGNNQTLTVNAAATTDYKAASDTVSINVIPVVSIGGTVYQDLTGNGFSSDDPGLAGIKVYLDLNNSGSFNSKDPYVVTAANGAYSFTDLAPGTYTVREVLPSGDVLTGPALSDNYWLPSRPAAHPRATTSTTSSTYNTSLVSNITYYVNGSSQGISNLRGNTAQGDLVQVTFTVAANVSNMPLTLVSYTAPGSTFDASDRQSAADLRGGHRHFLDRHLHADRHDAELLLPGRFRGGAGHQHVRSGQQQHLLLGAEPPLQRRQRRHASRASQRLLPGGHRL